MLHCEKQWDFSHNLQTVCVVSDRMCEENKRGMGDKKTWIQWKEIVKKDKSSIIYSVNSNPKESHVAREKELNMAPSILNSTISKKSWILCAAGNTSVMWESEDRKIQRDQNSTVEVVQKQTSQNFHSNKLP